MKTYTMLIFFEGKGEAIGNAVGFVQSRASGRVLALNPTINVAAEGALQLPTDLASFETVVMAQENRTWEAGRVEFPDIHSHLDVDTVDPGRFTVREDGFSSGSISWRVTGGGGRFEGARGVVTGNFVGHPDGTFTDHQLFKLVLPDVPQESL